MAVSAAVRKKTAVVKTKSGASKFPIPDAKHAKLAIQFENRAKPALTSDQRSAVESKAAKYGYGPKAAGKKTASAAKAK